MAKVFSKRIAFDLDRCKIEESKHLKSFFEELDQSQKEAEEKLKVLEENRKMQREQAVLSQSRGLSL